MRTILTLLTFLFLLTTSAQWTTDLTANTLVAASSADDMNVVATSDGKTCVVFWKEVPAPINFELRLQVLDENGNATLGADGILISDAIPMASFTYQWKMTIDENDDIYVGLSGSNNGDPAYAFKMDVNGNQLWGANGIVVGSGLGVTILPLSTGDAVVAWVAYPDLVLTMQKYDANGNEVWGSTQTITQDSSSTAPGDMYELANGDFISVFHSIDGFSTTLYAQRFDDSGVSQWATSTQLSDRSTDFNVQYSGSVDSDVLFYGYSGRSGNRFDSFLQKINADGTLPWGLNGKDFDTNQTDYEMFTEIAQDVSSQYVWAICSYSNSTQSQSGEYVQKFDKITGARLFSDTAKALFPISSEDSTHVAKLHLKNDLPSFLLRMGTNDGFTPTKLGVVHLDAGGDLVYANGVVPIATFSANKFNARFTDYYDMQQVAVFVEDKGSGVQIFAQNYIDLTSDITEQPIRNLSVRYNNPVDEILFLNSTSRIDQIEVYDLTGRIVWTMDNVNTKDLSVDTENWRSGIYLVSLSTHAGINKVIKILKQ